jgi:hypothetical protein
MTMGGFTCKDFMRDLEDKVGVDASGNFQSYIQRERQTFLKTMHEFDPDLSVNAGVAASTNMGNFDI